jgi:hypothetical protein
MRGFIMPQGSPRDVNQPEMVRVTIRRERR